MVVQFYLLALSEKVLVFLRCTDGETSPEDKLLFVFRFLRE